MEKKLILNELVYELNNKDKILKTDKILVVVNGIVDDVFLVEKLFLLPEKRSYNIKGYSVLQHFAMIDGFFVSKDDKISFYNERNKEHINILNIRNPQIQMNDIVADQKFIDECLSLLTKLKEEEINDTIAQETTVVDDNEKETIEEDVKVSDGNDETDLHTEEIEKIRRDIEYVENKLQPETEVENPIKTETTVEAKEDTKEVETKEDTEENIDPSKLPE